MIRSGVLPRIRLGPRRRWMGIAVTLCAQPEHERRENKNHHSLFRGGEKESLPDLIELGTPAFFHHESTRIKNRFAPESRELRQMIFCGGTFFASIRVIRGPLSLLFLRHSSFGFRHFVNFCSFVVDSSPQRCGYVGAGRRREFKR